MTEAYFRWQSVCVTGGSRGLGAALSRRFAGAGAHVHLADILDEEGEALAGALRGEGLSASYHHLDVAEEGDWQKLVQDIGARGAGLKALVNNAGLIVRKPLAQTTKAEWDRAMNVNVAGVFLGMKHCHGLLARTAPSAIVNISSTAGIIAHGDPSYTASKWAVRGLTKSAALEMVKDGIRVNSVHPAMIATPLTHAAPAGHMEANRFAIPMGREASPDEIANIVLFLASDAASFMTGSEVTADGGLTTAGVAHMRAQAQQGNVRA
ncbi:SDR family oxidoreductase [Roseomonas populi]|uniref:SDR family oxidoreductase n=1 Tax=Roseomonas populi TaxID=3121582 RepID=A0ABT1X549_9PROT|nr:SDR family oxidoreductase [Roseomonas pecuniae]MCR0983233.1 SDR family oxidoreductase [Roseomonas pecuniae]